MKPSCEARSGSRLLRIAGRSKPRTPFCTAKKTSPIPPIARRLWIAYLLKMRSDKLLLVAPVGEWRHHRRRGERDAGGDQHCVGGTRELVSRAALLREVRSADV